MFGRRKTAPVPLDTTGKLPVIRSSICTGERTAGFKDEKTGRFTEVMLIRTDADLQQFLQDYQLSPDVLRREW